VVVCSSCGVANREGARFCDSCGAPLPESAPVREVRKTVTVFFCDVSGSTSLGERIDPESLRNVMARYFETAKHTLERHGGTVEKFIGDAVMAVFGAPTVHEDDAMRALRAADELRTGLAGLNEKLERTYGTRLELRIGVNTGEVVTGTEERLATGDAVNVAARLEQAARPGEVLVGEETLRLVREGVEVEPVDPLAAKGKAEPVRAYRLLAVKTAPESRPAGAPMVGRQRQRKLLEYAFANVVGERSCQLFTVLGAAGVGKSRLVVEFLRSLEGATVARGRCLSYGEGIGYWPVTEVVKQLLREGDGDGTTGALGPILGDDSAAGSPDELAWAFRKLLEAHAAERPLVVVFDDVHWGEPAFLDMVEHVADLSRDAPILLLCLARPELLDHRPAWGGGKLNATNVLLEPLAPDESRELIESLVRERQIDAALRDRILESAAGNPLFVEEMVAMIAENDQTDVSVPPTIHALLAARLDLLDTGERGVLERGSVEGQVFHRGAVVALAPEETRIDGRLIALVRKDLVRPERAMVAGDEAFRFRHLLIRDTAYEALPKAVRAELHERFAAWLESHAAELVESDELVGYHLEQAYRYRVELGPLDEAAHALAERAAEHLLVSAERARARGDTQAAHALLGHAVELLPADSSSRREAQVELAVLLTERGEFDAAASLREEAAGAARAMGDERLLARLMLARVEAEILHDPTVTMRDQMATSEQALAELERVGDDEGVVWALRLVGNFKAWLGSSAEAERLWVRTLELAEKTSPRLANEVRIWMTWALWWGPTPVDEGIRRCDEFIRRSSSKRVEATALLIRGNLKAAQGRLEEGREEAAAGRLLFQELGDRLWWGGAAMLIGDTELLAGAAERAYEVLAEGHAALAETSETGYLATVVGMRAQAALELGRVDEALELADETERLSAPDDFEPHARTRLVRARALARRGDLDAADELIREAAEIIEPTDYVILQLELEFARADVDRQAGRRDAERRVLERAVEVAEAKGNLLAAERARGELEATHHEPSAF
jgi:class 3 adenylate cyclase/tetratricopeptide (TPR) repeat protein